jgi:hypothetical protein
MIGVRTLWRDFKKIKKIKKTIEMNFGGVNHPIGPPKGPPTVLNGVSFGIKILSLEYKGHLWLYFFILYSFGILFRFSR